MMVEDNGGFKGSDYNLIWCEVRTGFLEEGICDPSLKWKVDGKIKWEEYQQSVTEDFRGREEHMAGLWMGKGQRKCTTNLGILETYVLWVAEIGTGKKKLWTDLRAGSLVRKKQPPKHGKNPVGNLGKPGAAQIWRSQCI